MPAYAQGSVGDAILEIININVLTLANRDLKVKCDIKQIYSEFPSLSFD